MCFLIVLCAKLLFHWMDVIHCFDAVPEGHPPWSKPDPFVMTVPVSLIAIGSLQEQVLEGNRRNLLAPGSLGKWSLNKSSAGAEMGDRDPPFPQIDILRAMMIVWRARGKIIRSVLCNIVCNNCTQWAAHTHMNRTNSSVDWVLSHWAHFTVLRFIFVYVLFCVGLYIVCMWSIVTWWGGPGGIEAYP